MINLEDVIINQGKIIKNNYINNPHSKSNPVTQYILCYTNEHDAKFQQGQCHIDDQLHTAKIN